MKLKTKFQDEDFELGEVADVDIATMPDGRIKAQARAMRGGLHIIFYKTKAEFDADWEDAPEEPKKYWFIATDGRVLECNEYANEDACWNGEKAIGNFFETKEEAEKAVKKLKAFKRLEDKGFRFDGYKLYIFNDQGANPKRKPTIDFILPESVRMSEVAKDLDLLFPGGEE